MQAPRYLPYARTLGVASRLHGLREPCGNIVNLLELSAPEVPVSKRLAHFPRTWSQGLFATELYEVRYSLKLPLILTRARAAASVWML